jgi:translation elongation factor EF-4
MLLGVLESSALGFGFPLWILGMLHMEIIHLDLI